MAGWFSLTGWFWSLWAFLGWCVWLAKWGVLAATLFPEGPWYEKTEKQKTGNDMIATVDTLLGEIRAAWRKLEAVRPIEHEDVLALRRRQQAARDEVAQVVARERRLVVGEEHQGEHLEAAHHRAVNLKTRGR